MHHYLLLVFWVIHAGSLIILLYLLIFIIILLLVLLVYYQLLLFHSLLLSSIPNLIIGSPFIEYLLWFWLDLLLALTLNGVVTIESIYSRWLYYEDLALSIFIFTTILFFQYLIHFVTADHHWLLNRNKKLWKIVYYLLPILLLLIFQ